MPWKECHVVDERLRFIGRLLEGEQMSALCTEFGISRKTGYKIYRRYRTCGLQGLSDRSRRPYRHANQLPLAVEKLIVRLKRKYPAWGAPKIREKLRPQCAPLRCPAISTVHAVLDRHDLVTRRRRRRPRLQGTPLSCAREPNALWCADYKGECSPSRSALLLSPDDHGLRQPLSPQLRGVVDDERNLRLYRLRAGVQGVRLAGLGSAPTTVLL